MRQRRRPGGGPGGAKTGAARGRGSSGSRPRSRTAKQDNVERPKTDEQAVSAEGREQPQIEPEVVTTPAPVAEAPDTTTTKQQTEDPTKLDKAGDAEKPAPKKRAPRKKKADS